jgi:prepilin-type N-terminal cleavage/methylation domain-containing protein/prepilin-type processing-associated H-X9-DG protein
MSRSQSIPPRRSHGFTLVELLVVIAIIGVLIALLLPAVQSAREAARAVQCANHLKQIGLGLLNYESSLRVFPPGAISSHIGDGRYDIWAEARRTTGDNQGTSWMLQILPYIEQEALYSNWRFNKPLASNAALAQADIALFYCPSRRGQVRPEDPIIMFDGWTAGGNDYAGCMGYGNGYLNDSSAGGNYPCGNRPILIAAQLQSNRNSKHPDLEGARCLGILHPRASVSAGEIRDGMSNTIIVGEHQRLHGWPLAGVGGDSDRQCWTFSSDGWAVGGASTMMNFHYWGSINNRHFESPGSEHPGGAQFALADGSVHFFSENADPYVFYFMSTYDAGEVVPNR